MTQTEHLAKIRAKCVELVAKYPPCESTAGWKSTIAAIDKVRSQILYGNEAADDFADEISRAIIAAWPEELL